GAYQGDIDLSGIHLANLSITDGASQTNVHFNSVNPTRMQELSYKTGASQVKLYGLANANFTDMTFESGAGDYTLDFGGKLQQDATVTVKSGVSQVTIVVPSGMQVRVNNQAGVGSVDTSGSWTSNGDTYTTRGSGSVLTINVNMGVGSLKLEQH
ncbi:MAG TPA: LiaF domain-containing protein, partial [Anaerolineaceae bacterium]